MKWYWAVLFSLLLIAITIVLSGIVGFDLTWLMIIGTALWAAIDSSGIDLKKYKSGLSYGPVVLFFAIALLWIVGLPWYLHVRYRIKHGVAQLKESDQRTAQINQGSEQGTEGDA